MRRFVGWFADGSLQRSCLIFLKAEVERQGGGGIDHLVRNGTSLSSDMFCRLVMYCLYNIAAVDVPDMSRPCGKNLPESKVRRILRPSQSAASH